MGVYDIIEDKVNDRSGQVKLWDSDFSEYTIGDLVPSLIVGETYSIAMMEGGFVNIKGQKIESWTKESMYSPVLNKWGGLFNPYDGGYFDDDPYTFPDDKKNPDLTVIRQHITTIKLRLYHALLLPESVDPNDFYTEGDLEIMEALMKDPDVTGVFHKAFEKEKKGDSDE